MSRAMKRSQEPPLTTTTKSGQDTRKSGQDTREWITLGAYFALAIALTIIEGYLPPPPFPFPLRYGFSNLLTMQLLLNRKRRQAYILAVAKGLFSLFMRGLVAGILSLMGGLVSLTIAALILWITRQRSSYLGISIPSAIAHNLTQMVLVSFFLPHVALQVLLIPLISLGIASGALTGTLLYFADPVLQQLEVHQLKHRQ